MTGAYCDFLILQTSGDTTTSLILGSDRRICNSVFNPWLELAFCLQSKQFSDFVNCSRIIARLKHSLNIRCVWLAATLDLALIRSWCTVIKVMAFQFHAFYVWKTHHAKFSLREMRAELFERFMEDNFAVHRNCMILVICLDSS